VKQGKLRVAVFFGGRSVEHGVSIVTAAQVMGVMDGGRYEVLPVYAAERGDYWLVPEFDVKEFGTLPLNPGPFDGFARAKGGGCWSRKKAGCWRRCTTQDRALSAVDVDVAFSIIHRSHGRRVAPEVSVNGVRGAGAGTGGCCDGQNRGEWHCRHGARWSKGSGSKVVAVGAGA
jgi:hypothetical protein